MDNTEKQSRFERNFVYYFLFQFPHILRFINQNTWISLSVMPLSSVTNFLVPFINFVGFYWGINLLDLESEEKVEEIGWWNIESSSWPIANSRESLMETAKDDTRAREDQSCHPICSPCFGQVWLGLSVRIGLSSRDFEFHPAPSLSPQFPVHCLRRWLSALGNTGFQQRKSTGIWRKWKQIEIANEVLSEEDTAYVVEVERTSIFLTFQMTYLLLPLWCWCRIELIIAQFPNLSAFHFMPICISDLPRHNLCMRTTNSSQHANF